MPNNDYWRFRDSLKHSGTVEANGDVIMHAGTEGSSWKDHKYIKKFMQGGKWVYDYGQGVGRNAKAGLNSAKIYAQGAANTATAYGKLGKNALNNKRRETGLTRSNAKAGLNSAKIYAQGAANTATAYGKLGLASAKERLRKRNSLKGYGKSVDNLEYNPSKKQTAAGKAYGKTYEDVRDMRAVGKSYELNRKMIRKKKAVKNKLQNMINRARAKFGR